jgi:alkylation response protein AidB-like acyl-CoA dehydrogenase
MPNYFTDNSDVLYQFNRLNLKEIVQLQENDYKESEEFNYAPVDFDDAKENYYKVLEVIGDISGNYIAERAGDVDEQGAVFKDGKVFYADGTAKNLEELSRADLMGMILPRRYDGLNFPFTLYVMAIEIVSRADASLMNIFGLQDIADTINKFGNEEQKQEYLPGFTTGKYTGAMALTEPDAGSDLQAVKLQAYQDEKGQWFLKGVKRFITNGNGDVLLVLARSEPGSKDGRGLSMFACYGDDTVTVRRIENKLGIHGSPTCELQFNDTPATLIGKRRFGLIKYTFDLMFRARMGVSAQALGISEAAYEEAYKYAKDRVQFNKPILEFPAISNMLINMRVAIEANRSLFYSAAYTVDMKENLEKKIERLKEEGKSVVEETQRLKELTKWANILTPMSKYVLTESANQITYDALQIHGGTGYMKEFNIERLARDARITNIYEGTSQLQIVAAVGGVVNDVFGEYFSKKEKKDWKGSLKRMADILIEIREIFLECRKYVVDKKDANFYDTAAKDLVELYIYLWIGYLLLEEAEENERKIFIANRYILDASSKARNNAEKIKNELYADIIHAGKIL